MTYKERINLCKKLLTDIRDMIPDEDEYEKEQASIALESISDYTSSMAFLENKDEEKTIDSWNILMNAVNTSYECLEVISNKLFPRPPKYVSKEEAYKELADEYLKALESGDETVASMNINEWMEQKSFVIVDEDIKISSSSDDETVNSKTKF